MDKGKKKTVEQQTRNLLVDNPDLDELIHFNKKNIDLIPFY